MKTRIILISLALLVLYFITGRFEYLFLFIPAVLFLSYNLSKLVLKIKKTTKSEETKKRKNLEYIIFIGLISMFFAAKPYEDTIGGLNLFWKFSFLSILATLLAVLIFNKFYLLDESYRHQNLLAICVCFQLLVPNLGIVLNKYIYSEPETKKEVVVNSKNINKSTKGGLSYELFIATEYDPKERLVTSKKIFDATDQGKTIVLTLRKGILGYDYITKIEAK